MKIGIMTFHRSENFGAALQAYALQNKLLQLGHQAYIIDFRPPYMGKDTRDLFSVDTASFYALLRSILASVIMFPWNMRYRKRWMDFSKNILRLTEKIELKEDINYKGFDVVIVGSDQVWNVDLTGENSGFFLEFLKDGIKKIAYAASAGDVNRINCIQNEEFQLLNNFDVISVRENYLKRYLSDKIKKNIEILPDPSFLIDRMDWEKLLVNKKRKNDKYIFEYIVQESELVRCATDILAKKYGLNIYEIGDHIFPLKKGKKHIHDAGPIEFLQLIRDADMVICTSFHGVVFSILFHKEFYTFSNGNKGGRIDALCDELGLSDRIVNNKSFFEKELNKIDYLQVDKKIDKIRLFAIDWLRESLEKDLSI